MTTSVTITNNGSWPIQISREGDITDIEVGVGDSRKVSLWEGAALILKEGPEVYASQRSD